MPQSPDSVLQLAKTLSLVSEKYLFMSKAMKYLLSYIYWYAILLFSMMLANLISNEKVQFNSKLLVACIPGAIIGMLIYQGILQVVKKQVK
jgi:hypothetical protein